MAADPCVIATLRRQLAFPLWSRHAVLPFGDARIDAHLPGGGLPVGQLHEIGAEGIEAETGTICGGFAAAIGGALLRRTVLDCDRVLLWIATDCDLYAPGLLQYGVDPGRLILVQTRRDDETLQSMETALRSGASVAVVGEVGTLTRLAARRLQLACLNQGSTGLLLRRWPHGRKPGPPDGNAAVTRWRLSPVPSGARRHETGPPTWQVELLHARGGRPGGWVMQCRPMGAEGEMQDASPNDTPHPLRVAAILGDHTGAPRPGTLRRRAE